MIKRMPWLVTTVVLALSITGGAVAASKITGAQVKDNSLTGKDIKNKSLTKSDFKGSVRGARGSTGPAGPAGPAGPGGPAGPAGPTAVSAITPVAGSVMVAAGESDGGTLLCPDGQKVISGGFFGGGTETEVFLSAANDDRTGWQVAMDNTDGTEAAELDAFAYCAGTGKAVTAKARSHRLKPLRGHIARMVRSRG
jgi:hypothetical protein